MSVNFYLRKLRGAAFNAYELLFTLFVIVYTKIINRKTFTKNSNKFRVLQYSEAYELGGVLKVVERLSLGLSESSEPKIEQVLILIDKPEIKEYFEKVTQNNSIIIKTHYINLPSEYFNFKEFYHLKSLIQKDIFNIAHIHLYAPDSCRTAILAASMAGIRVITTEHNNSSKTTFRLNVLKRLNQHLIHKIIAVSDAVRERLVQERGIDSTKIQYIPNGIDSTHYNINNYSANLMKDLKSNFTFNNNTLLIGMIGALHRNKGYNYLLLAAKSIIKKHPNTRFIFIGEGQYREELEEITRDLDLTRNVEFLGYIADVSAYYGIFDIFVLPSLVEGMPLCLLEAMAMGVPVIATAVDGNKELVVNGETGLLVPPKDVTALTEAIEYMIENPGKAKEMGNAGKKRIQNNYSLQKNIEQTIDVYLN